MECSLILAVLLLLFCFSFFFLASSSFLLFLHLLLYFSFHSSSSPSIRQLLPCEKMPSTYRIILRMQPAFFFLHFFPFARNCGAKRCRAYRQNYSSNTTNPHHLFHHLPFGRNYGKKRCKVTCRIILRIQPATLDQSDLQQSL